MSNDVRAAADDAIDVATRITRVTVFEDRADVIRIGELTLPAGGAVVKVRDLPAVISDEHVIARLEVIEGGGEAFVNDVRVDRYVIGGDDENAARRRELQRELEAIDDEVREKERALERGDAAAGHAEVALSRWIHAAGRAAGRGVGDVDEWKRGLAQFEQRLQQALEQRAQARQALSDVKRKRARTADAAGGPGQKRAVGQRTVSALTLRVSSSSTAPARARLVLSTLVPCAAWRPTHEATLLAGADKGARRVRFVTHGAVWNRTGEAWEGAELTLSTARPSAGAELPPIRADRLTLRQKTAEERKTIVVEHRDESVPKSATQGTAPGVDDGGEARVFRVARATIPDDGRPHRVELAKFEAPASVERVAFPELSTQVFLRASLKNAGAQPVLAGAVTLIADGAWVGTGDVLYVGTGEAFDLSFGSDDRFVVRTKKSRAEDKKLVGKDVVHFLREATLVQTGTSTERVLVHLRLPVSEVKQLRVLPSPQHSTEEAKPDEHGIVRIPVELEPHVERKLVLAFSFDASGDVRIPAPW